MFDVHVENNSHPLWVAFGEAVKQARSGKGTRHGGDETFFYDQPWVKLFESHGIGFLTGQAAKKLNESVGKNLEAKKQELLGVMVYTAMAWLALSEFPEIEDIEAEPVHSGALNVEQMAPEEFFEALKGLFPGFEFSRKQ